MACHTLLLLLALFVLGSSQDQNPTVKISHGLLQGVWRKSTNGRTFASFRGVPYASPPIGNYRFQEPQQLQPWTGVWDASKPLSVCLQYEPFLKTIIGNEDCLFLNVHTPNLDAEASLPVVVFIHGGAFMYGAGSLYESNHIMDRDVVVVTFNYRLGPLGFLSTGDEASPGNNGLKDQAFALKWVRNNIKMFGGNPESVTLTGCSAGGASVHYHYLSPLSKGSFDRGIAFSGSALGPWTHSIKAPSKARALAAIVGCPTSNTREMVDCLRSRPGEVIVDAQFKMFVRSFDRGIAFSGSALGPWTHSIKAPSKARALAAIVGCPTSNTREMVDCLRSRPGEVIVDAQFKMFDWNVNLFTIFTPTAEPKSTQDPFLTEYPYHATNAGTMQRLPLITSVTSEEGLYPAAAYLEDPVALSDLESKWENLASFIFEYNDTLPLKLRSSVANKIKQEYLGGKPVGQETFPDLVQALGDRLFVVSVGKMAQIHALKSGQPTYFYRYSYRGTHSFSNLMANNENNYGVSHADDVIFIFKYFPYTDDSPEDIKMRDALLDMVYSYASAGIPKLPNAPEWKKVKPGAKELDYLDIVSPDKIGLKSCSDFGKKSFWDSLGFLENENYNVNHKDEL